jgi:hypothetical protein
MNDKKQGVQVFRIAVKLLSLEILYFWNRRLKNRKVLEYLNTLETIDMMFAASTVIDEMKLNEFELKAMRAKYPKLSHYLKG